MKQLIRPRLEPDCRCGALDKDEALISIAISLKRFVDALEEANKARLELMPEGYIGEQEHRQLIKETLLRDVVAWEAIADAATFIAGRKARGEHD